MNGVLTKILLLFLFGISSSSLVATELLTFQQLTGLEELHDRTSASRHLERELRRFHQKEVTIRGFLSQSTSKQWILSSQPQVQSCCFGRADKVAQQIFLPITFTTIATNQPVTIQGRFLVDPQWDSEGRIHQLYRLEEVILLPPEPFSLSSFLAFSLILFGIVMGSKMFLKNRKNPPVMQEMR